MQKRTLIFLLVVVVSTILTAVVYFVELPFVRTAYPTQSSSNSSEVGCRVFTPLLIALNATKSLSSDKQRNKTSDDTLPVNVGILYVCTGKYIMFLSDFLDSFEAHFLRGFPKVYFIFTDANLSSLSVNITSRHNLIFIQTNFIGWPHETLYRFKRFNGAKEAIEASGVDYLYFLNANLICMKDIETEIIPRKEHGYFVVTLHPGYFNQDQSQFPYERNPFSLAYIATGDGKHYFAGGFYGGRTSEFLEFSSILERWTNDDEQRGIIPVWHDESMLNRYMLGRSALILSPSYLYPEGLDLGNEYPVKIFIIDKNKHGGHAALRSGH